MNWLWLCFASVLIFTLVEETISSDEIVTLYRTAFKTPLALKKKLDSTTLQLAIPHENEQDWGVVNYHYNDSEKEFLIACPAFYERPGTITDEYWKETPMPFNNGATLFQMQYVEDHRRCFWELVPSIKKIETETENVGDGVKYCNQPRTELYGVGYELRNSKGENIQYAFVYKICYLKDKNKTLYSIHRIETPSLLLLDHIEEFPQLNPLNGQYKSFLDPNENLTISTKTLFESGEYYAYQYVGVGDMLIRPWKLTTYFLFNYTPITKNADIFKGMTRVDIYIRLYSKKNNKRLTLYSGTHQTWISVNTKPTATATSIPIDSFWRLVMDDEGHAIIIVTEHTLKKCGRAYLCEKKRRRVKKYKRGGCIYTCSLEGDSDLLESLNLRHLTITGDLDFTIQTEKTKIRFWEKRKSSTKSNTDIFHFLSNANFFDAIGNIYPDIAKNMRFRRAA